MIEDIKKKIDGGYNAYRNKSPVFCNYQDYIAGTEFMLALVLEFLENDRTGSIVSPVDVADYIRERFEVQKK